MPFDHRILGDPSRNLVEVLIERAGIHPEKRLFTFLAEGESEQAHLDFGELDQRARTIAAHLEERGWAGQPALLLYPPGLELIAAFWGCLYAGVIAVPCYPPRFNRPQPRLAGIVDDARPAAVLTTAAMARRAERLAPHLPAIAALPRLATDALDAAAAGTWRMPDPDPDALAFLQYTSGSTAAPKGVMVSHGNLVHNAEMIRRVGAHDEDAVVVSWLPPYHDMGLIAGILQPIYAGGRCVLMSPVAFLQKPVRWLEAVTRYRGTTSGGPNFAYDLCVRKITAEDRKRLELSSWRVAFNGAEPVRADTVERFARVFARCGFDRRASYPCYGLAEATLLVTGGERTEEPRVEWFDPDALEAHRVAPVSGLRERVLVSCGRPQAGQELRIVDPDSRRPCPPERVGELWVAGPSVAKGYWRRAQETAHDFDARLAGDQAAGPFLRTGDLGFLWDGELYVTGRLKDLIIIRGRNHYPQDLELTVGKAHPLLLAGGGAAFSVESGDEERLVVVHELRRGAERNLDVDALSGAVRQAISEEHEVQVWDVVLIPPARLPKTSSGKVQRRACRAAYLAGELPVVDSRRVVGEDEDEDEDEERSLSAAGLRNLPFAERRPRLIAFLCGRLARVVGVAPQRLDPARPLTALGLDSLRAVELGGEVGERLGIGPSQAQLLAGASLEEVADELLAGLEAAPRAVPSPAAVTADDHPLSHGQRALWFLEQLRPGTTAYLLSGALRIRGELDAGALKRALARLVARHPALRTTFKATAGEPRQVVHDVLPPEVGEEDATAWTEAELGRRLAELARRPFDLARGPLFRFLLFRRTGEQVLLVTIHHLVSDLWSIALLFEELEALYRDQTGGPAADLPALPIGYADYVRWQEAVLASERGEQLAAFWQERLAGELPALDLPTDRPRPAVPAMGGGLERLRLRPDLAAGVEAVGERAGATLFMTLTAAFQVLLHRYGGQREILLGAPTAGRSAPELQGLIGYFVNPVVLRADLGADPSFAVFLDQTRQTVLAAFAHQDYPFPRLAEDLRSVDAQIFQAMLVFQQTRHPGLAAASLGDGGAELELFGLPCESLCLPCRDAQFDLTLYVAP
ncbi:MAG: AMP-binding protein, partial [bacterium]|nr:AMP-binding protein [bacterium]